MRIELRDLGRRRLGRITIDPAQRPTRVSIEARRTTPTDGSPREAFLNWETALDDAGQLRRCVACGCGDLFKEKAFPQVTAFVVVLAFVGAIIGALGLVTNLPVLILMAVVLVLDVAILFFSRRRLVCYRCRSTYHDLPMARYHRTWDRAVAERYPAPARSPEPRTATFRSSDTKPAPARLDGSGAPLAASAAEHPDAAEHKGYFAS